MTTQATAPSSTRADSATSIISVALRDLSLPTQSGTLDGYLGAHPTGHEVAPFAIVAPSCTADIQRVIDWARRHKIALSTFSSPRGQRERGATARVPTLGVDLSAMQRVLNIDARDAVAIVEPGVTFAMLDVALKPHGLRSHKPLLPRRGKSVVASYLEREPILGAREHWDILDPFGGAEMVFGTGEIFRTGSAAIPGTMEQHLAAGLRYLTAHGPAGTDFLRVLQGAQGTLGIVTWATVMCEPIPKREQAYFVGADRLAPLLSLLSWIQWRHLGNASFIVNRSRLATLLGKDTAEVARLAPALPVWALYVQLDTGSELPEEKLACDLGELRAQVAAAGLQLDDALAGQAAGRIMEQQHALPAGNYKDRRAGAHHAVFFLCQADQAERFVGTVEGLAPREDIGVYLQPRLQGRNCHLEFDLPYDPAVPGAAQVVGKMAAQVVSTCARQGGFFSRPYGGWAPIAFAQHQSVQPFLRQTKAMFDPDGVLNPGRLCF